jgi:Methyltransferase FkbM domain
MNLLDWLTLMFPDGGYYVEAGAHDGVGDSQTLALEKLGWKGLCIEPSRAYDLLVKSRKCSTDNRVLWTHDGEVDFRLMLGEDIELSGVPHAFCDHWDRDNRPHLPQRLRCTTLGKALLDHSAPNRIQFLSLDLEGAEYEVLKVHNFNRHRFVAAVIEHNGVEHSQRNVFDLMIKNGYKLVHSDTINDWFLETK